jgi:hypothetical protein
MEIKDIIEDLLYLPLDLPNPPTHELSIFKDICVKNFYRDKFRTCWQVPLYTDHEEKGVYKWSPLGNKAPELKAWIEEHIMPLSGGTRMTFICTLPGDKNAPHIDCSPDKFETLQHKFRFVMEGNVDDLIFLGKHDKQVRPPNLNKCFMMAGNWPHEMENTHSDKKFTLAIGAPWEPGLDDPRYVDLIKRSYEKYSEHYISNTEFEMVDNWEEMFENYEKGIHKAISDYWKKDAPKEF